MLRFIDGFDHYTSNTNAALKWNTANATSIQSTTARNGNAAKFFNITTPGLSKTLDNQASWVIGFAFRVDILTNSCLIVELIDTGTIQCSLRMNTDGTLEVVRSNATALNSSGKSSLSLLTNTWYYIEWKVTISNSISANTCKVNVNGVNWINVDAAQNVRSSSVNQASVIEFIRSANSTTQYLDDLYIMDGVSSTPANNDFVGDVKVETLSPSAAGNYSQWTADTGTNYTRVNEANPDGNTSYVETSTVNNIDTYAFGDLASTPTAIYGVQINTVAEKTDAGTRTFSNVIRISSTDYVNANAFSPSNGSYADFLQMYEADPSTTAQWGATNVNGMEAGYKLIS